MLMELLGLKPTGNTYADAAIGTVADPINVILTAALLKNRKARGLGREAVGEAEEATLHAMRPNGLLARGRDLGPLTDNPVEESMSQALRYAAYTSQFRGDFPDKQLVINLTDRARVRPEVKLGMDEIRALAKQGTPIEDFMWGPSRGFARPFKFGNSPVSDISAAGVSPEFLSELNVQLARIAPRRTDLFDTVEQISPYDKYASIAKIKTMLVPPNKPLDVHGLLHEAQHIANADDVAKLTRAGERYGQKSNSTFSIEFPAIFEELQSRLLEKRFEEAVARNALQSLNRTGLLEAGGMGAWNAPAPFFWGGGENG